MFFVFDWLFQTITNPGPDGWLLAVIAGCFTFLSTVVTAVAAILTARINRGNKRYDALMVVVNELVGQNAEQADTIKNMRAHGRAQDRALKALEDADARKEERIAELSQQLGEFQEHVRRLHAILDATPDATTLGEIRSSLPKQPEIRTRPRGTVRPAPQKEGQGDPHD